MIVNGTTYHDQTPQAVIEILERNRAAREHGQHDRLILEYGDRKTGHAWGDEHSGMIGRSMGPIKIPLLIHNRRSLGGLGLLEHCIVRIRWARGGTVLWAHPTYQPYGGDHA